MKDSWLFYEYLRRWWWLLILVTVLGGLCAIVYQDANAGPPAYTATVTYAIIDPTPPFKKPPAVVASITSGPLDSVEAAVDDARAMVFRVASYTNALVVTRNLVVELQEPETDWWKDIILGSVVGLLLAIGGIYVWEDACDYQRQRERTL